MRVLESAIAQAPPRRLGLGVKVALRVPGVALLARWGALPAIVATALFLRIFRLEGIVTYYPDTYGQLRGVDNLLSADFPISYLYPPGVAILLSPIFAFLPSTLVTLQAIIITASLALVVLSYAATYLATKDRRAALFAAAAVAIAAPFIFYSRVALFDVVDALAIGVALLVAPRMGRSGLASLALFGVLVFAVVTIRYTNFIVLPALFLASLPLDSRALSWRVVAERLRSRAFVTVVLVLAALAALYVATAYESLTRFLGSDGSGSVTDFGGYFARLGQYWAASLVGQGDVIRWQDVVVASTVFVLAAVGGRHLWHSHRAMTLAIAYLIIVWAPVHAVYSIFASRYAIPPFLLVILLASIGLSLTLARLSSFSFAWQRIGVSVFLGVAVSFFVLQQVSQDFFFLRLWPTFVAIRREDSYDRVREALQGLDGQDSVLLSSQLLAVDRANPAMESYDLILHSDNYGINGASVQRLVDDIRDHQEAGKTVYYHYTEFEFSQSDFRKYEASFDSYFSAIRQEFSVRELAIATAPVQFLYVLGPPETSSAPVEPDLRDLLHLRPAGPVNISPR